MSYQWSFQGTNLPGATSEVLVVTNVVPGTVGYYSLVASNALGVITNSEMELSMVPFIITGQPTNQAVYVGASPTLSVTVLGESPSYQWWVHRATSIAGATNSSLTITNIQLTDAGTYRVSISNSFGVLTSSPAYISVSPILVTQSPQDQVMFRGGTATFNIAAQASSPLSYQWLFNGMELADTDTNTLTLPNVLYEQAGSYTVIASTTDAVVTNSATLSVVPVAAWGDNSSGQTDVPANLTNIIAIAGGGHHALVLKADGSVIAWGDNTYGQTNVPAGLTNVVAIAAGADHNLVLKTDGTVVSWGRNNYGQTNVPQDLTDIVAIGGGSAHSLALTSDGRVIAWGYNSYGQTNVPPDLTNAVAIAAGGYHNVALTDDGLVLAWGDNSNGQTNTPSGLTNVVVIGAGSFHSLAVTANGAGFAWGYNSYGQTNVPPDLTNAVATSGGLRHSLALRLDGTVTVWGGNTEGQTNVPAGLANVQAIAGGMYNCYALVGNGPPVVNGLPVNPVWSNHVFSVSLASQNNHVYRLEHKDSLADSAWVAHPLVAGTGGVLTLTDPTATGAQRFYRVRRW